MHAGPRYDRGERSIQRKCDCEVHLEIRRSDLSISNLEKEVKKSLKILSNGDEFVVM